MNTKDDISTILSLIPQPAFCVQKGKIVQSNSAAEALMLPLNADIENHLGACYYPYLDFRDGFLFLTFHLNGHKYQAFVSHLENADIFVLDDDNPRSDLQTLATVAAAFRQPVSSVIASVGNLTPLLNSTDEPKNQEFAAQMNHHLWQMHRMLCNMTDAIRYVNGYSRRTVCRDLCAFLSEIFQKVQDIAGKSGISFKYTLPKKEISCLVDTQILERAIYNMISNAIKASSSGTMINAVVVYREKQIFISIEDLGNGILDQMGGDLFRYLTRPNGIASGEDGLGLGMILIRSAAMVHNGTVLIDRPYRSGTRITLCIPHMPAENVLQSSRKLFIDYAGGWDHCLLELSDVLPSHLYGI